jgi:propane monooxygenase coupling protein
MTASATDRFKVDRTSSNRAGVTLMNNQVGHTVADVMRGKEGVTVEELPSMIRVDGHEKFDFDYAEIAEALDDRVLMFANPEDAAEYIDFDLKPVS